MISYPPKVHELDVISTCNACKLFFSLYLLLFKLTSQKETYTVVFVSKETNNLAYMSYFNRVESGYIK